MPDITSVYSFLTHFDKTFYTIMIGFIAIGIPLAILTYTGIYYLTKNHYLRKHKVFC